MGWVKTEYRFPRRCAILVAKSWKLKEFLEAAGDVPDELEKRLRQLIVAYRPSLAGCVVEAMRYDEVEDEWQIKVSHESFPLIRETAPLTKQLLADDR